MTDNNEKIEKQGVRFSVVIPAFNAEQTIARALDSVLQQTYAAFEIIVVDDASKDTTRELVHSKYPQVQLVEKLFNSGSSVARNAGMDSAKGDYIAFLDADDIWHRDKLSLINTILSAKPDIRLFYHPFTQENIANKNLPEDITVYKLPFIKLLPGNVIATSCAVVKNDPAFRFETSMRYTEDFDLWLRIGYKYKIFFVNIPLTQIFRPFTSPGGISENKWKMRRGELKAYSRLAKLNPLFIALLPALWLSSLGKHFYKMVTRS